MKSRMFAMLSSLTLLTAGAALAQNGRTMKAAIPFEFRAGEKALPAGQYDVRVDVSSGIVSIQNIRGGVMVTSSAISTSMKQDTGKLVFKRYGGTYFLSAVCGPEKELGRRLKAPKAEKSVRSTAGRTRSWKLRWPPGEQVQL